MGIKRGALEVCAQSFYRRNVALTVLQTCVIWIYVQYISVCPQAPFQESQEYFEMQT